MNKSAKIAIIGGAVLLLVLLLYYFGFRKGGDETYVSDDWSMTYNPDKKGPYGTFMLKELLDTTGLFGNFLKLDEPIEKTLKDAPNVNDIYFFIGGQNFITDTSTEFLLDFVDAGNTALIATEYFPDELLEMLCYDRDAVFDEAVADSVQFTKFLHPEFKGKRYEFEFVRNNKVELKNWYYFNLDNFITIDSGDVVTLGTNTQEKANFVKINYGEGQIFLHSTPYAFTNISLMKRDGFQYAENVLRHIPPGRVQWDKYNLYSHSSTSNNGDNGEGEGGGGDSRESMLQFILNNPPLLWAFLILLIGAVLYALFKGKRMQKVVPPAESKENMSLQYISTLSSLYLQEKKHNKLIKLKEKTFLNFIADHYYIHSSKPDDKFFEKVAIKSHIPKEKIVDIFKSFDTLEGSAEVSDQALIALHQKIENFYKNCR